jgi:uncharacterized protein (TIGR02677 family)
MSDSPDDDRRVTSDLSQTPGTIPRVEAIDDEARGTGGVAAVERAARRPRRLGGVATFDYLGSSLPLAGTYRAIMGVFLANSETFGISIPTEQVYARLQAADTPHEARSPEHLEGLLENLERWGNVSRTQDASLAKTIEDLKRKRSLWRITEEGRLAEEAARRIETSLGAQGALRSNLLAALEEGVGEVAVLARKEVLDEADGRAVDNLMSAIFGQAKELADSASAFIANLDDFLSTPEITSDAFVLAREVIVGYVGGFLTDLRQTAPVIAATIEEIRAADAERLIAAAARSNPPPSLDPDIDPVEVESARIRERWQGVGAWFVGAGSEQARSRDLANRAAEAITSLLRILARLNDARHRTISRSRDFVALAGWFEAAPDDATAHRIWHAAFGLAGARHFSQVYENEDEVRVGTSWWTHPALAIDPRLRSLGRNEARGRPPALEDTTAAQARIRANVRARTELRARALTRFLDAGEQRLSALPELTDDEFELLTEALATALPTRREADGSYLASSLDGRYLIRLAAPPAGTPLADVRCPRGTLRGLDWAIELVSVAAEAGSRAAHRAS